MRQVLIIASVMGFIASSAVAGSSEEEYECKLPEKYLCGETGGGHDKGKGKGQEKVAVCHKGKTLYLPKPAVQAHMKHGDKSGACKKKQY